MILNKNVKLAVMITIPLVIVALLIIPTSRSILLEVTKLFSTADPEPIKEYIRSFGILAVVVSFLLMVFQSLAAPLPAFLITFANAAVFGWAWGALLSWTSSMVGAVLCYAIARLYGRDVVEKFTTRSALNEVDVFFERYGKWAVLIARLLPFVSFDIVSYAAGLTGMGFWEFLWATGLGQLPATIIYSYVGGMLTGSVRTLVFGLFVVFALSVVIIATKQIWTDKQTVR